MAIFPMPLPNLIGFLSVVLAQTGTTKTLIGWVIVLLCAGLGLLAICRPSARIEKKKRAAAKSK